MSSRSQISKILKLSEFPASKVTQIEDVVCEKFPCRRHSKSNVRLGNYPTSSLDLAPRRRC